MKNIRLITSLVICAAAIATIVAAVRGCRKASEPAKPAAPLSAAERTQALIRERMSDPNYTNGLAILADRQARLASLSHEAADEFATWSTNFFASNAVARALFENIGKLAGEGMSPTNADFAAKVAELESMMAADPRGRYLLDKRAMIAEALAEHGRITSAFIGGRLYRQMREHSGEEAEAARLYREKLIAEGKIKPPVPRPRPAMTNAMSSPRTGGWWTNQPALPPRAPTPAGSNGQPEKENGK